MPRQLKLESCPRVKLADNSNATVMQVQDFYHDGESRPRRIGSRAVMLIGSIKPVEDMCYLVVRNTRTRIRNGNSHRLRALGNAHVDVTGALFFGN